MTSHRPPPLRPPLLTRIRAAIPTPLALALLAISIVYFYKSSPSVPKGYTYDWDSNGWYLDYRVWKTEPFKPSTRYQLGYGSDVLDCSESGGMLSSDLEAHDLKALGIKRFQDKPVSNNDGSDNDGSLDQTEGDAFCIHIHNLTYGASQPRRWSQWSEELIRFEDYFDGGIEVHFHMCFPENGGVWLLSPRKYKNGYAGMGLGKARTMEERCAIFKKKGARFCQSLQDSDCPQTKSMRDMIKDDFVEDGWLEHRWYKALLIEQYG